MMHTNKYAVRFNEIPLDVPAIVTMFSFDDVDFHLVNHMVRTGTILITARPPDYGGDVIK
ncbi:hypothetical protein [Zhongshania sp.]|jgi:hypothetical protein|uniref:hypothetical protein n=1 Tax=Zhongshania sp. TaxID=1971902 RepID=UPI001B76703F|nr:hypothetical protein [Zhongshania sp.]MBQ0795224.1 hypothetical protein [Zhongshania sp.]|tara:strand:+ start:1069 stop:1248 length:180 start_codon:yes stop_codon:yes gene_type:complete